MHSDHSEFRLLNSESFLVSRQSWIDLDRPLVDPSDHALSPLEAQIPEEGCDLQTTNAMVTVDDDAVLSIRLEFCYPRCDLAGWN